MIEYSFYQGVKKENRKYLNACKLGGYIFNESAKKKRPCFFPNCFGTLQK